MEKDNRLKDTKVETIAALSARGLSNIMTDVQLEVVSFLKTILKVLYIKDCIEFARTGVRRYFIVDSVDDVITTIKRKYPIYSASTPPKNF